MDIYENTEKKYDNGTGTEVLSIGRPPLDISDREYDRISLPDKKEKRPITFVDAGNKV